MNTKLHPDLKPEKCEDELCERKQYARAAFNFKGFCCARCMVRGGHSASCDERNEVVEGWETDPNQMCDDCKEGFAKAMNTNEVVEMIDAITEGRNLKMNVETEGDLMNVAFSSEDVIFQDEAFSFRASFNSPRTAREIAGALVAWANRKEGSIGTAVTGAIIGQIRWAESGNEAPINCNKPNIWKTSGTHRRLHEQNGECSFKASGDADADLDIQEGRHQ